MTTTNATGSTALIHGGGSTLGQAVALELARRKLRIALSDQASSALSEVLRAVQDAGGDAVRLAEPEPGLDREEAIVRGAIEKLGGLDVLINVLVPTPETDPRSLGDYPGALLTRCLAAANAMSAAGKKGTIVNHCFLPAMYAGTKFDPYMPAIKGSITGVTRTLCRQFGKAGIRVNCVQTGLLDMPETKAVASPEVLKVKVPVGRWATCAEVAKMMTFLALDNGYISGQCIILDGGLTAGITGT
jgi:3-oxoacyl-[acyl-carrier protein] reductase